MGHDSQSQPQPGPAAVRHAVADDGAPRASQECAVVRPECLGLNALASLLEASLDGIVVIDEERRYIYANPAACRILGYPLADLVGRDFLMNFAPRVHQAMVARFEANLAGHPGRWSSIVVRPDGEGREIEYANMRLLVDGRTCTASIFRDVTDTRRLVREQEALVEVASRLADAGSLDLTLKELAANVVRATGAEGAMVVPLESGPPWFRLTGAYGLPDGFGEALQAAIQAKAQSPSVADPPSLMADSAAVILRSGITPDSLAPFRRTAIDRDVRRRLLDEPSYAPLHPFIRNATWDTVVGVPMVYHDRHVGVVIAYYRPGQEPTDRDIALLTAIADQAAVAVENARLLLEAQGRAALEERQRLARELHDSVSQAIYGIGLGTRTARTLLDQDPSRAREPLDYVLSLADAAMAEMRALIFELRPESLETEGLVAALGKQAAALQARHGIAVDAMLRDLPALPLAITQTLYRIAQEALHNVIKHARASRVGLRLEAEAEGIVLEVCDDGLGFDPRGAFPGHLGLRSMRERVAGVGGCLTVESTPGKGTCIRALVPVRAEPS